MYFSQFPYLQYPSFDDPSQNVIVKDITARVVNDISKIQDTTIFYQYTINDGDTPQNISFMAYGSVEYYWVIMIINNLFDMNWDFPLNTNEFNDYISAKYGSVVNAQNVSVYFLLPTKDSTEFYQVTEGTYNNSSEYVDGVLVKYILSAYDWEMQQNEAKRNINLLRKDLLQQFKTLFSSYLT